MEDARFVDQDDRATYYATYTAYDGRVVMPQLIENKRLSSLSHPYPNRSGDPEQRDGVVPEAH